MISVFSEIYNANTWGSQETVSGLGSELIQTAVVRREIPVVIKKIGANSLLDVGCGDCHWITLSKLGSISYIGVDVTPELIVRNEAHYTSKNVRFVCADITKDSLPPVDMVLAREVLVHFCFRSAIQAIKNLKNTKSKYLLATTYPNFKENEDIVNGRWRPINLELPPFNFPEPIALINEHCTLPAGKYEYDDICLGLWKFADIPF